MRNGLGRGFHRQRHPAWTPHPMDRCRTSQHGRNLHGHAELVGGRPSRAVLDGDHRPPGPRRESVGSSRRFSRTMWCCTGTSGSWVHPVSWGGQWQPVHTKPRVAVGKQGGHAARRPATRVHDQVTRAGRADVADMEALGAVRVRSLLDGMVLNCLPNPGVGQIAAPTRPTARFPRRRRRRIAAMKRRRRGGEAAHLR
jgi:hypothetical protein